MSAFMVSKTHIDALVNLASAYRVTVYHNNERHTAVMNERAIGQMLVDENVASVGHRYGDDNLTDLPGPTNAYWVVPYRFTPHTRLLSAVEGIKAVQCYEYQSCEHPEWKDSLALKFCKALMSELIRHLPGYEEAAWDLDEVPV